jgi:hypothetical protein
MIRRLMDWAEARFGAGAGLIPASVLGLIFVGLALLLGTTVGPARQAEGIVTGFGKSESELGSKVVVSIKLPDGFTTLTLRRWRQCTVGDRIDLRVRPMLWGRRSYSVGPGGCKKPLASIPSVRWTDDAG